MNCNCIEEQEARILAKLKSGKIQAPRGATGEPKVFNFTGGAFPLAVFKVRFGDEAGTYLHRVNASHCPFCGVRVAPPDSPEPKEPTEPPAAAPAEVKEGNTDGAGI